MRAVILLAETSISVDTWIGAVLFAVLAIAGIGYLFHLSYSGKKQYGLNTLTPEEQARVREDLQSGFHGGRVFLCRDGVVINGKKIIRYRDIVWIRLLNVTYTAARIPVMHNSRVILYDSRGKTFDLECGAPLKKSLQSSELKSLNVQEFLQMLCANAPWSIVGKEGENISFRKKKKMVQEKYDQIMNQERHGQS